MIDKHVMRWIYKQMITMSIILLSSVAYAKSNRATQESNILPSIGRQFLNEHFKGIPISHIQVDKDFLMVDCYNVILTDGTSVEFDHDGEWIEIKRHNNSIPSSLIPKALEEHIKVNYPSSKIVVIEKDAKGYEVKLNDGLEIEYDSEGKIIEID